MKVISRWCLVSSWLPNRPRQFLKYSVSVLPGVLLVLTVGTIVFAASLRYPYALLTVRHSTVSPDVCSQLDSNATLVRYDVLKLPESPNFECISTETSPSVTVCLFDIWHDVYVSRSLQAAGVWEPFLVNEFTEAIRRGGPKAGVCIPSICFVNLKFLYVKPVWNNCQCCNICATEHSSGS